MARKWAFNTTLHIGCHTKQISIIDYDVPQMISW